MSLSLASYKPHLLNAVTRSLLINLSVLFVNSLFIATVGAGHYSKLFFLGTLGTASFYLLLMTLRERTVYTLYQVILVLFGVVSVAACWRPDMPGLLYAFNTAVLVTDMLGASVSGLVLQASANPVVFREVYHRVISIELIGRLAAAAAIWGISHLNRLDIYYGLAWVTLIVHMAVFRMLPKPVPHRDHGPTTTGVARIVGRFRSATRFAGRNDLARLLITLTIWTYVTKFLTEFLFFQTVNVRFPSAAAVGAFVSATSIGIILLTLLFQQFVGRRLTARLPLASLFTFQPLTVLTLGTAALLMDPFYPLVTLMIVYQVFNRSIQLPVSRQLLVPMPASMRSSINFLIPLMTDLSVLLVTGLLTSHPEFWTIGPVAMLLIGLGGLIFLVLTQLDSFYVKNMWSMYREGREGRWRDAVAVDDAHVGLIALMDDAGDAVVAVRDSDSRRDSTEAIGRRRSAAVTRPLYMATQPLYRTMSEVIDRAADPAAPPEDRRSFYHLLGRDDLPVPMRVSLLLDSYARLDDPDTLAATVAAHRRMLRAGHDEAVIGGLHVLFQAGLRSFHALIVAFTTHPSPAVIACATACLKAQDLIDGLHLDHFSAVTRRRLRTILLEQMGETTWATDLTALTALANDRARERAAVLIDTIYAYREPAVRSVLFACTSVRQGRISLVPVLEAMATLGYGEADSWRRMLGTLGCGDDDVDAIGWMNEQLQTLVTHEAVLGQPLPMAMDTAADLLMHVLFVAEWTLGGPHAAHLVIETIPDLAAERVRGATVLVDIHLEFLKRSEYGQIWVYLLGRQRTESLRQQALAGLGRLAARNG